MVEYRQIPEEHEEVFFQYASYAFRPENGPESYEPDSDWPDLDQYNGLYPEDATDEDRPLCISGHQWYEGLIRGDIHSMPGYTAAATPPERRRQGLGQRMLEFALEEYRERDAPFTILWPFWTEYYRKYGWEIATELATYSCPPSSLSFTEDATGGTFRRIENEFEPLNQVYTEYMTNYALLLDRDKEWWKQHALSSDSFVYLWEKEETPKGYLRFNFAGGLREREMNVHEIAYVDFEAYRHLLHFCRNHDSQVETIRLQVPRDDDLLRLATNPEDVDLNVETGPMVRIVDVENALSAISYPDTDASITVSVDDPLVEWNCGRFRLSVSSGEGTCSSTQRTPDVKMSIGSLSQLVIGYRSSFELSRTDRIDAVSPDVVDLLDRLFPPRTTYHRQKF